jgi:hypothetical protein
MTTAEPEVSTLVSLEAKRWNLSLSDTVFENFDNFQVDSNFAFLLSSLICGMIWIIYITYYNSRVIGYIVTRLLKRFYIKDGYLKVGMVFLMFRQKGSLLDFAF